MGHGKRNSVHTTVQGGCRSIQEGASRAVLPGSSKQPQHQHLRSEDLNQEVKGERRKSPNPVGWQLFQRRGKGNRQAAARTSWCQGCAWRIKKSHQYPGKLTLAIYTATAEYVEEVHLSPVKHRVSVSGILKYLGVSRSSYNSWKKREPSNTEKRREAMKQKIQEIYDKSHQNYGAPKITKQLNKDGEPITERTVGIYMRQMGIKAQWIKPFTHTTIDPDFSLKLKNILDEQFNPEEPNAVWVSDITYIVTFNGFVYLTSTWICFHEKSSAGFLAEHSMRSTSLIVSILQSRNDALDKPLVFHNDRGTQYVSDAFKEATVDFINSYSKKECVKKSL